jgi:hypothetical protein
MRTNRQTAFRPVFTITPAIAANLMRIEAVRQAIELLSITPRVLASLRETARLFSTHYSTMIEGNRLTQEQVVQVIGKEQHFPGRERDEAEVKGYYTALDEVERAARLQEAVTEAAVQRLHAGRRGCGPRLIATARTSCQSGIQNPGRCFVKRLRNSVSGFRVPGLAFILVSAMSRQAYPGKCHLCAQIMDRAAVTRHLALCREPQTTRLSPGPSFHFVVEGRGAKAYWMHVALPGTATLAKLDAFLRETWLECCGHLSGFEIAGERYASDPSMGEASMKRPLQNVVGVGLNFSYKYDYGSTTELKLKVAGMRADGTPKGAAQLLARNEPPAILCDSCGVEQATEICAQCAWDEAGWLCPGCADTHSCGEETLLPVTNSPRVGVCAYCG